MNYFELKNSSIRMLRQTHLPCRPARFFSSDPAEQIGDFAESGFGAVAVTHEDEEEVTLRGELIVEDRVEIILGGAVGLLDYALVEQSQTDVAGELVVRRRAHDERFPSVAPVETVCGQADRQSVEKVGVGV